MAEKARRGSWGHGGRSVRQGAVHITAEQEAEFREPGLGKPFKGVPTDLRLPARSHLLKVPQPLRIALAAGEQGFKTRVMGNASDSNHARHVAVWS